MSGVVDFIKDNSFGLFGGSKKKRKPSEVPTLDDARVQQMEGDRLRKRRGNLANVFGGASNLTPVVAGKTLLGQ